MEVRHSLPGGVTVSVGLGTLTTRSLSGYWAQGRILLVPVLGTGLGSNARAAGALNH